MLNRGGRHARGILGCRRSIASMEFALVAPLMLILLGGVYDTSEALILYTEVYNAAHIIPAAASDYAVQSSGQTILSYAEIQLVESQIWADIPSLRSGFKTSSTTGVTLTSVTFTPPGTCADQQVQNNLYYNKTGCQYTAYMVWSVAYSPPATDTTRSTFVQNIRPCEGNVALNAANGTSYVGGAVQVAASTSVSPSPILTYLDTLPTATATLAGGVVPGTLYTSDYANSFVYNTNYEIEAGPSPILVADVEFTYKPGFSFIFHAPVTFMATGLWPVRSVATTSYLPIISGNTVINPLGQEFTELFGTETGTVAPVTVSALYGSGIPTSNGVSGGQFTGGTTWCVDPYEVTPNALDNSSPVGGF